VFDSPEIQVLGRDTKGAVTKGKRRGTFLSVDEKGYLILREKGGMLSKEMALECVCRQKDLLSLDSAMV
jgi:hypothetical protein